MSRRPIAEVLERKLRVVQVNIIENDRGTIRLASAPCPETGTRKGAADATMSRAIQLFDDSSRLWV